MYTNPQLNTIYVFDRPLNKCIVSVFNPSPALLHYMFVDCVLKCPYFKCTKRYISIVCVLYFQNIHISCAPRSVFFFIFLSFIIKNGSCVNPWIRFLQRYISKSVINASVCEMQCKIYFSVSKSDNMSLYVMQYRYFFV